MAPTSIAWVLAAIGHHHRQARLTPPHRTENAGVITDVLASIQRSWTGCPDRKAAANAGVVMRLLWSV